MCFRQWVRVAAIAALVGNWPTAVSAQTDFSGIRLNVGDEVFVTRASGLETRGTVKNVSPTVLTFDGTSVSPEPGLRIERGGDSLWNGVLWGFGVGLVGGVVTFPGALARKVIGSGECNRDPFEPCLLAVTAISTAVGALIDYLHRGRTEVFRWQERRARFDIAVQPRPHATDVVVRFSF